MSCNIVDILPSEVFTEIFKWLTLPELVKLCKVSKYFHSVSSYVIEKKLAVLPLRLVIGVIYYKDENKKQQVEILSRFEVGKIYPPIIETTRKAKLTPYPSRYTMMDLKETFERTEVSVTKINHDLRGLPKLIDILRYPTQVSIVHGYSEPTNPYVPEVIYNLGNEYTLRMVHHMPIEHAYWRKYKIQPEKQCQQALLNVTTCKYLESENLRYRKIEQNKHLIMGKKKYINDPVKYEQLCKLEDDDELREYDEMMKRNISVTFHTLFTRIQEELDNI